MPSQQFCRENQIWWALEEDEKLPFARTQIVEGYRTLSAGLYNLTSGKLLRDEELIIVYEKMFELDKLVFDEDYLKDSFYVVQHLCAMAGVYARLGQDEKALEVLKIAAEKAIAFDNRPEEGTVHSILLGEREWKRTDYETDDMRTCKEIMRDKWLASKDFRHLRELDGFGKIIAMLTE